MSDIIKVENLKKHFKEVKAVDGISFSVEEGSLFAFLGLNGAGKTTTINVLCGSMKKDEGNVMIDGIDLDQDIEEVKRRIGIVFQGSVLDGRLSVFDNLMSRGSLYGFSRKHLQSRIDTVTELFEIGDFLKRPYKKLSGGQKRRVDIARAFINEPKVLFLDEPTTGLDPSTRIKVWDIIEKLRDETGLTIFLTTHYMEETVRADRVVIIDNGKILASDTPDNLKNNHTEDYVRVISVASDEIESIIKAAGRKYVYKNSSYYITVHDSKDALEFLNQNPTLTNDFEILKGDMDDVFLNITGKSIITL